MLCWAPSECGMMLGAACVLLTVSKGSPDSGQQHKPVTTLRCSVISTSWPTMFYTKFRNPNTMRGDIQTARIFTAIPCLVHIMRAPGSKRSRGDHPEWNHHSHPHFISLVLTWQPFWDSLISHKSSFSFKARGFCLLSIPLFCSWNM
jgi:hypothetical protein